MRAIVLICIVLSLLLVACAKTSSTSTPLAQNSSAQNVQVAPVDSAAASANPAVSESEPSHELPVEPVQDLNLADYSHFRSKITAKYPSGWTYNETFDELAGRYGYQQLQVNFNASNISAQLVVFKEYTPENATVDELDDEFFKELTIALEGKLDAYSDDEQIVPVAVHNLTDTNVTYRFIAIAPLRVEISQFTNQSMIIFLQTENATMQEHQAIWESINVP